MSVPPSRMRPDCGAATRSSKAASVDLPDPDGPSTATRAPCGRSKVNPSNTGGRSGVQRKRTASNRKPVPDGSGAGFAGCGRPEAGRAASSTRAAAAAALPAKAPARGRPAATSNAATSRNTAAVDEYRPLRRIEEHDQDGRLRAQGSRSPAPAPRAGTACVAPPAASPSRAFTTSSMRASAPNTRTSRRPDSASSTLMRSPAPAEASPMPDRPETRAATSGTANAASANSTVAASPASQIVPPLATSTTARIGSSTNASDNGTRMRRYKPSSVSTSFTRRVARSPERCMPKPPAERAASPSNNHTRKSAKRTECGAVGGKPLAIPQHHAHRPEHRQQRPRGTASAEQQAPRHAPRQPRAARPRSAPRPVPPPRRRAASPSGGATAAGSAAARSCRTPRGNHASIPQIQPARAEPVGHGSMAGQDHGAAHGQAMETIQHVPLASPGPDARWARPAGEAVHSSGTRARLRPAAPGRRTGRSHPRRSACPAPAAAPPRTR